MDAEARVERLLAIAAKGGKAGGTRKARSAEHYARLAEANKRRALDRRRARAGLEPWPADEPLPY